MCSLLHPALAPLLQLQADTYQAVDNELDRIIQTGFYIFTLSPDTISGATSTQVMLEFRTSMAVEMRLTNFEKWNMDQIGDFVRKLEFLDKEGDKIKHFLQVNKVNNDYTYRLVNIGIQIYMHVHNASCVNVA